MIRLVFFLLASVGLFLIPLSVPASSESPVAFAGPTPGLPTPPAGGVTDEMLVGLIGPTTTTTAAPITTTTVAVKMASTPTTRRTTTTVRKTTTTVKAKPTPATSAATTNQLSGIASWYGAPAGSCAMLKIPMGTSVHVVNTKTGASTNCVVNTRGPHIAGRVIDLAKTVFAEIGNPSSGVISVTVSW